MLQIKYNLIFFFITDVVVTKGGDESVGKGDGKES